MDERTNTAALIKAAREYDSRRECFADSLGGMNAFHLFGEMLAIIEQQPTGGGEDDPLAEMVALSESMGGYLDKSGYNPLIKPGNKGYQDTRCSDCPCRYGTHCDSSPTQPEQAATKSNAGVDDHVFEGNLEQAYWDMKDGKNPLGLSERDRFKQQVRKLLASLSPQAAGEWLPISSAPRDKPILLNAGYPWAVVGIWNDADKKWAYANLQCGAVDGKWNDTYWENEQESAMDSKGNRNIDGWQPLPTPPSTPDNGGDRE